jgi:hypothetical protein
MNRQGHEAIQFFIGTEVEHTPAAGMKTLFVVGLQPVAAIDRVLTDPFSSIGSPIQHVYFGANQSFGLTEPTAEEWNKWTEMVSYYLDRSLLCTLDLDVRHAQQLLDTGLTEWNTFIPMISVKLPCISQLGYNATLKLDDYDFSASNPGVWCHSLHQLQSRQAFTAWHQYTQDTPL